MGCGATPTIINWPNAGNNYSNLCPACQRAGQPAPAPIADTCCSRPAGRGCPDADIGVPLFYNKTIKEQPVDLDTLSDKYGDAAEEFIGNAAASGEPFFLFYANSHMHVPQNHAARWTNASARALARGAFGASLLEMDNEVGRVMAALKASNVDDNTLVMVTGDNGPWECKCNLSGSSGPFVGQWMKDNGGGSSRKTTLWEGGHRVVGLARWPARIPAGGVSNALSNALDYFPTAASVAGLPMPADRSFDGVDLSPVLFSRDHPKSEQELEGVPLTSGAGTAGTAGTAGAREMFHPLSGACGSGGLGAARLGKYKAVWQTGGAKGCGEAKGAACKAHAKPLIFDLEADPAEATALDPETDPAVAKAAAALEAARKAKVLDIDSTPRSVADYSQNATGRAANCCDSKHMECSCQVW